MIIKLNNENLQHWKVVNIAANIWLLLRGYTSVNAKNLDDFREFFGRKVLN